MKRFNSAVAPLLAAALLAAQSTYLAPVVVKPVSRTVELPGEFLPFLQVSLHARVPGYVEHVLVDRGSAVKQGDLLVELSAPEMSAQIAEAQSKAQSAEADRLQAAALLASADSTYQHLKKAAETPGAIAGNELEVARQQVAAARALLASREQASQAMQASAHSFTDMQTYLKIRAPFSGMVTERLVHPGALVGPGAGTPLLTIQQISRLRLVVAVPEEDLGIMATGGSIAFTVPAAPDRKYSGTLARIAHSLDEKTRAMAVELDVPNRDLALAPGMYPSVKWPIHSTRPALFVPKTSVVTTTERTFVVRNHNGKAEWVDVRKGTPDGDLVEVAGDLQEGDEVVRRATDELRAGAALSIAPPRPASK